MSEMLRKITIKNCGFDVQTVKMAIEGKKSADLLKIAGVPGQTDKGSYLLLQGEFRAVNLITGEVFESSSCILPNFISDRLAGALQVSEQVEFALMISAKSNPSSVTGYEYTVTPLVEAAPSDRLAHLLESSGMTGTLALAKPKKAA
ncbi:MAG: hypothetical protein EBR47_07960 [Betaproteobacteria bacterium]|nr:hypothetical protein [Betaproteobacteria bacterium]